jgi:hypothetical protein
MSIFRKPATVFIICFLFSAIAVAQKKDIAITWNPFSFMEIDAGFTPGIDIALGKKISILSDAGIIFYDAYGNYSSNGVRNTQLGYKLKPEFRYYTRYHSVAKGLFFSVEGLYKHVTYKRYDGIPVFDNMGNQVYTDFSGYTIIKDVFGGSVKLGGRFYFNKNYRLGMDIYWGLGARVKNFAVRDLPPGGSFNTRFFSSRLFDPHWEQGSTASMPFGFKLIWRFNSTVPE